MNKVEIRRETIQFFPNRFGFCYFFYHQSVHLRSMTLLVRALLHPVQPPSLLVMKRSVSGNRHGQVQPQLLLESDARPALLRGAHDVPHPGVALLGREAS